MEYAMQADNKSLNIWGLLFSKKSILHNLNFIFLVFLVIFCGCQRSKKPIDCLEKEEKKDLYYLFHQIMDNESGAYVLFGSKPLCTGYLDARKRSKFWRDPDRGWRAWEKVKQNFPANRYILTKRLMDIEIIDEGKIVHLPLHYILFADVLKTAYVLAENYDFFKSLAGRDFHPLEIVFELENPDSSFWSKIFSEKREEIPSPEEKRDANMALGLLFGFGKRNTFVYTWKGDVGKKEGRLGELLQKVPYQGSFNDRDKSSVLWSQIFQEEGLDTFLIPGFVTFEEDDTAARYKKERKKIQEMYRGRDFLEVTVNQLCR
jgi:hypothetical protein